MMASDKSYRDRASKAIINSDLAALNKYKTERALYRKVEMLTIELVEIKLCLSRLNERLEKIENK